MNKADRPAISSYDKITLNADGSPDLYFGPKAPAGLESNWVEKAARPRASRSRPTRSKRIRRHAQHGSDANWNNTPGDTKWHASSPDQPDSEDRETASQLPDR